MNYHPLITEDFPLQITEDFPQCGAPQIAKLVNKSPMNTIVIGTINHSYWSYVHQLGYRKRGPHIAMDFLIFRLDYQPEADHLSSGLSREIFSGLELG